MTQTTSTSGMFRWICPTLCDDDCELNETNDCHEWHQPRWKRNHQPDECWRFRPLIWGEQ